MIALGIVVVLAVVHRAKLEALFESLNKVKAGPIELGFDIQKLNDAKPKQPLSIKAATILESRILRNRSIIQRTRILWVDDSPANNQSETEFLRDLGIDIDTALSTAEALEQLRRNHYDLLITDQSRPEKSEGWNRTCQPTCWRAI